MSKEIGRYYEYEYDPDHVLPTKMSIFYSLPFDSKDDLVNELMKKDNKKAVITAEEVKSWFTKSFFKLTQYEKQDLTDILYILSIQQDNENSVIIAEDAKNNPKDFFEIKLLPFEAEALAHDLNILRVTKPVEQLLKQKIDDCYESQPMKKVLTSLRQLADYLPEAIQLTQKRTENTSIPKNSFEEEFQNIPKQFLKHLQNIQAEIKQLKKERHLIEFKELCPWHPDAVLIVTTILKYAMWRGKKLSYQQVNSQLIKITKLALERAGVVNASESAIVQALLRFPTKEEMEKRYRYESDEPFLK